MMRIIQMHRGVFFVMIIGALVFQQVPLPSSNALAPHSSLEDLEAFLVAIGKNNIGPDIIEDLCYFLEGLNEVADAPSPFIVERRIKFLNSQRPHSRLRISIPSRWEPHETTWDYFSPLSAETYPSSVALYSVTILLDGKPVFEIYLNWPALSVKQQIALGIRMPHRENLKNIKRNKVFLTKDISAVGLYDFQEKSTGKTSTDEATRLTVRALQWISDYGDKYTVGPESLIDPAFWEYNFFASAEEARQCVALFDEAASEFRETWNYISSFLSHDYFYWGYRVYYRAIAAKLRGQNPDTILQDSGIMDLLDPYNVNGRRDLIVELEKQGRVLGYNRLAEPSNPLNTYLNSHHAEGSRQYLDAIKAVSSVLPSRHITLGALLVNLRGYDWKTRLAFWARDYKKMEEEERMIKRLETFFQQLNAEIDLNGISLIADELFERGKTDAAFWEAALPANRDDAFLAMQVYDEACERILFEANEYNTGQTILAAADLEDFYSRWLRALEEFFNDKNHGNWLGKWARFNDAVLRGTHWARRRGTRPQPAQTPVVPYVSHKTNRGITAILPISTSL